MSKYENNCGLVSFGARAVSNLACERTPKVDLVVAELNRLAGELEAAKSDKDACARAAKDALLAAYDERDSARSDLAEAVGALRNLRAAPLGIATLAAVDAILSKHPTGGTQ